MSHARQAAALAAAALALALGVATAQASGGIGMGRGETAVTLTWSSMSFATSLATIRCPLTLSGSIDAATPKRRGWVLGEITRAAVGPCTGGTLAVLTGTMPWLLRYSSFSGTLPTITSVTVELAGVAAQATVVGMNCLYGGTGRGTFTVSSGTVSIFTLDGTAALPLAAGGLCTPSATVSGTAAVSPSLSVTLLASTGDIFADDVAFPDTPVNGEARVDIRISNQSEFKARIGSVRIVGADAGAFSISTGGFAVNANTSVRQAVTFTPAAAQEYSATVEFLDAQGAVMFSATVRGRGT